jgi:phosphonate transport system substrate-binding protein
MLRRVLAAASAAAVVVLILVVAHGKSVSAADGGAPKLRLSLAASLSKSKYSEPLVSYLEKETGAKIEVTFAAVPADLVENMANNKVDIGYFGGLEYVQISTRAGATPLVQSNHDQNYHTVFITQPQLDIHSLKDLTGHTFVFGAANSVSSRVMPEYWLHEAKVDKKVIDDAITRMNRIQNNRHGGPDVALAVARKEVDAGGVNLSDFEPMMKKGEITAQQVRVFWEAPVYPNSVWAARKGFDPKLAESFSNAFLKLDPTNPEQKEFLTLFRGSGTVDEHFRYVRAKDSSYDLVRKAVKADGLLR